jgi:hypothetical protein
VDGATYEVANNTPLRLGKEIVDPAGKLPFLSSSDQRLMFVSLLLGDNCGGSYLNDKFKEHLLLRLRFEKYLEVNDNTLKSIVNRAARDFEAKQKPVIDIMTNPFRRLRIEGLRGDRSQASAVMAVRKRFENNILIMES